MDVVVEINKQELIFSDMKLRDEYFGDNVNNDITVYPTFSSDWNDRTIYYSLSTNCTNYTEVELTGVSFTIPSSYYKFPGAALYFFTDEVSGTTVSYRKATNFLKFHIGGM